MGKDSALVCGQLFIYFLWLSDERLLKFCRRIFGWFGLLVDVLLVKIVCFLKHFQGTIFISIVCASSLQVGVCVSGRTFLLLYFSLSLSIGVSSLVFAPGLLVCVCSSVNAFFSRASSATLLCSLSYHEGNCRKNIARKNSVILVMLWIRSTV